MGQKIICSKCGYEVVELDSLRCPRCNASLLTCGQCSGQCLKCEVSSIKEKSSKNK